MLEGEYVLVCPNCGSRERNIYRLHRSRLEKIMRRRPKFYCPNCHKTFFCRVIA